MIDHTSMVDVYKYCSALFLPSLMCKLHLHQLHQLYFNSILDDLFAESVQISTQLPELLGYILHRVLKIDWIFILSVSMENMMILFYLKCCLKCCCQ